MNQIIRRLLSHTLQIGQLIGGQPIEVPITGHQPSADELFAELIPQAFDVHRVPAGKVTNPLLEHGRTIVVGATNENPTLVFGHIGVTFGTSFRK